MKKLSITLCVLTLMVTFVGGYNASLIGDEVDIYHNLSESKK